MLQNCLEIPSRLCLAAILPTRDFEEISYSSDLNAYGRSGPMRIPSNPMDVRTCERMWLHGPLKPNPFAIQSHSRLDNEGSEDEPTNVEPDIVRWLVTAISPPALVGLVIRTYPPKIPKVDRQVEKSVPVIHSKWCCFGRPRNASCL